MWKIAQNTLTTVSFVVAPASVLVFGYDTIGFVANVVGNSMQPTLNPDFRKPHDWIWMNKWNASNYVFDRGEIVSFTSPKDPTQTCIKRIIALEGDVVRPRNRSRLKKPVTIPHGFCWVEGDNHAISEDSNSFGPLTLSLIKSRVRHIVWPPSRWQRLDTTPVNCDRVTYSKLTVPRNSKLETNETNNSTNSETKILT